MNKDALINSIAEQNADLSKKQVKAIVESMKDVVGDALAQGETVTLPGIGNLKTTERKAREGRNPRTGEAIKIPACRVPKMTFAKQLKEKVAK